VSRDRGAASIFVLAVGLVLVAAGLAGAAVGTARIGRHQARTAADLGALAGAGQAIYGESVACRRAEQIVTANGGRMTACAVDGLEIVVGAAVEVHPLPGLTRRAEQAARAGPLYSEGGRAASTVSNTRTAPGLCSGLLPLPHFGDWTHDGHPVSHPHDAIASRVADSHSAAVAYARSAKPAPPG